MALARGGAFEGEGRGQEDRRLQRAFGQHRVEAIAHHQRRGRQRVAADLVYVGLGLAAWGGAGAVVIVDGHDGPFREAPVSCATSAIWMLRHPRRQRRSSATRASYY